MHQYISEFSKHIGHQVTIKGWVINIRSSKTNCFFDFRDGSGFTQCVVSLEKVGEAAFEEAKNLTLESSVAFTGTIIRNEKNAREEYSALKSAVLKNFAFILDHLEHC